MANTATLRRTIRRADLCRLVPFTGSPATMSRARAEAILREELADYDAARAAGLLQPGDQFPYIEG